MACLQAGDHIFCYRNGKKYTHHGIYEGNDMVIHLMKAKPRPGNGPKCQTLGCDSGTEAGGVVRVCFECFKAGDDVSPFMYGVSLMKFAIHGKGTCSVFQARFRPEEVVERARDMMKNGFGKYSFLGNNCECFALYCTNGERVSQQVKFGIIEFFTGLVALAIGFTIYHFTHHMLFFLTPILLWAFASIIAAIFPQ